jgi:hypothetical protein
MYIGIEPWSPGFMTTALPALIAVAGTLLGSALTYLFQSRTSSRAEASALQRELRTERREVYSSCSAALAEYRQGQLDWHFYREEDPNSAATLAARVEAYRLKGIAQAAVSRVQLVAGNPAVVTAANDAFELTRLIHYAQDVADRHSRNEIARNAINRFITLAGAEIQSVTASDLPVRIGDHEPRGERA